MTDKSSILCVTGERSTGQQIADALTNIANYIVLRYSITIATSAAEALTKARAHFFDLYLIDHLLTDGSGLDVSQEIRRLDPNVPVVFYSDATDETDRLLALAAGAQAYLVKPLDYYRLRLTIDRLLKESELKSAAARIAAEAALHDIIKESRERPASDRERAVKLGLRHKVFQAFIQAGGTRAHFERLWQDATD